MNRIHTLDYLRGGAALGIMFFHYLSWTLGEFESDTLLGRIGVYGVSIFYILSGLTLYHVYKDNLGFNLNQLTSFFRKRIFRIFPLLWLVTLSTIFLFKSNPNWVDIFLNLSGLFGVFKWSTYLATGTWSIGNEISFYLFFPFFLWVLNKSKIGTLIFSSLVFCIYLFFAFYVLDNKQTLSQNWHEYVNPLNQLFLFASGMLVGYLYGKSDKNNVLYFLILIIGLLIFALFPVKGNSINIVTGLNRIVFTLASLFICIGFYKLEWQMPQILHTPLKKLGDASYSVYLLHPLLYAIVGFSNDYLKLQGFGFSETIRLLLSFGSTLGVSYLVYTYYETYFMKIGKNSLVNTLVKEDKNNVN
jgi:peptidoglycan/LPS O-acetylase OafA/YrhL